MTKKYEEPKVERIMLATNDVIRTSGLAKIDFAGGADGETLNVVGAGMSWNNIFEE